MGSKGGGPDPMQMAQAQTSANQQAALQSMLGSQFNQVTPFGNLKWTGDIPQVDPETGKIINTKLIPSGGGMAPGPEQGQMVTQGGAFPAGTYVDEWSGLPYRDNSGNYLDEAGKVVGYANGSGINSGMTEVPIDPRTMTIELSEQGQHMKTGMDNIARALLNHASGITGQIQAQQPFSLEGLNLPARVNSIGANDLLSNFGPARPQAASQPGGAMGIYQAMMRR